MWIAECSGCGELVSDTGGTKGVASLDLGAYLAAGCAADHFLNPVAALAEQEINIKIPPIKGSRPLQSFAVNAIP
jgi:hypothetical protein